ncbi:MAG: nucleotidyltransferase family protein [Actinobacteria bacterium]|nr:nucleotidyltransferase family protein [Actinomycetota bacterium]MCG2806680.1 nucleotidyltransferase family protein [Coriobacteriia bacterium]
MTVDAVVLAGGDGAVIDPQSRFKGLLPIAGRPMVAWVVDALRASENVAEIAVVVPSAEDLGAWVDSVDKLVVADGDFLENVLAGVGAFRNDRPTLVVTGDIPALTPEAVDDFVLRSIATGAEFTYPLIRKSDMLEQFPGSVRTFVKLIDAEVTGGNMMLVNPYLVAQNKSIGQKLFDTRKSAIKMARVIGFRFVLKLALGRLEVQEVEAKLAELLGGPSAAIYTPFASIGADVDKPADVVVAERVLQAASSGRN